MSEKNPRNILHVLKPSHSRGHHKDTHKHDNLFVQNIRERAFWNAFLRKGYLNLGQACLAL